MNTVFRVKGEWDADDLAILRESAIQVNYGYILLSDSVSQKEIWDKVGTSVLEKIPVYATFNRVELDEATSFMIKHNTPTIAQPCENLSKSDDGLDFMRNAYDGVCVECFRPVGEQTAPITLEKQPKKLSSKYLWGTIGMSGLPLITDVTRAKLLNNRWGITSRKVLIGRKQVTSDTFVQLDVKVSRSPLVFGNSCYGNSMPNENDYSFSGGLDCENCSRTIYTVRQLDFFPAFKSPQDVPLLFTQEWFGGYPHLVGNREFITSMIEKEYIKYNDGYLVPVCDFI